MSKLENGLFEVVDIGARRQIERKVPLAIEVEERFPDLDGYEDSYPQDMLVNIYPTYPCPLHPTSDRPFRAKQSDLLNFRLHQECVFQFGYEWSSFRWAACARWSCQPGSGI